MIYIYKFLPALMSPLAILIYILVYSLFKEGKGSRLLAIFLLLLISNPIVGNLAIAYLEKDYPPISVLGAPKVDLVIVLGGMVHNVHQKTGKISYEFNGAVDRINAGIKLIKYKRANKMILTRGKLPWKKGLPEGEFLREFALEQGISINQIILTDNVENTDQEAKVISQILDPNQKIALITSAFHMDRALMSFKQYNLHPISIPVDHRQNFDSFHMRLLMPSSLAVMNVSLLFRETLGKIKKRFFYYFN